MNLAAAVSTCDCRVAACRLRRSTSTWLGAGDSLEYDRAVSRSTEILWPVTVVQKSQWQRSGPSIAFDTRYYRFPEDFTATADQWKDRSWVSQRRHPTAGLLEYRSGKDIVLRTRKQEWKLTPEKN